MAGAAQASVRRRPDYARKIQRDRVSRTFTRQCAISSRAQPETLAVIEETVARCSKLNFYARELVTRVAWQRDEFPFEDRFFVSACATLMEGRHGPTHAAVSQALVNFPFPRVQKVNSKGELTRHVAVSIKTNFVQNLIGPFEARLRRFIREQGGNERAFQAFKTGRGLGSLQPLATKRIVEDLRCEILGLPMDRDPVSNELGDEFSSNRTVIDRTLLEQIDTQRRVLKCYKHILPRAARKFPISPSGKNRRYCIRLEAGVISKLLLNHTKQSERAAFCRDEPRVQATFRTLFRPPRGVKGTDRIIAISTDGIACNFIIQRPLPEDIVRRIANASSDHTLSQAQKNRARRDIIHASLEPNYGTTRCIAVDPGRSSIMFAVERSNHPDDPGGFRTHELSRKFLYSQYKKKLKVPLRIADIWAQLRNTPRKVSSLAEYDAYLFNVAHFDEELWGEFLKRRYARDRFDRCVRKQKVLDRFLSRIARNDPMPIAISLSPKVSRPRRPHFLYGAASFPPTGRGEKAVPVSRTLRRCKERFRVTMVNEYGTSRICADCAWVAPFHTQDPMAPPAASAASDNDVTLAPLIQRRAQTISRHGYVNEIRGVKHCCCPSHPSHKRQVHRDFNAAVNILHLGILKLAKRQRPALFTRRLTCGAPRGPYLRRPRRVIDTLTDAQEQQIVVNNHAVH